MPSLSICSYHTKYVSINIIIAHISETKPRPFTKSSEILYFITKCLPFRELLGYTMPLVTDIVSLGIPYSAVSLHPHSEILSSHISVIRHNILFCNRYFQKELHSRAEILPLLTTYYLIIPLSQPYN